MSRIGLAPVKLADKTEVKFENQVLTVKGPKGELKQEVQPGIDFKIEDGVINVSRQDDSKPQKAFHGLYRALLNNMVIGVSTGFEKKLELYGTGYRANVQGKNINMSLGFSHEVIFPIPEGINVEVVDQTKITLSGIDKQLVGETAAKIRKIRKVEPYKGKGIRYAGEAYRSKEGKSGKR